MLTDFFANYAAGLTPYKGGNWCYEDGLIYTGLQKLHVATGDARWLDMLLELIKAQVEPNGDLSGYQLSDYNIDNIRAGTALLYLHKVTKEPCWMAAADRLATQLDTHPRTASGVYWHKLRYPWQVWLDGIYMGQPFQIEYAQMNDRPDLVADSLRQTGVALDMCFEPKTGLYAHAIDEARQQKWADPKTGRSASAHWSRALGWLAMALVDIRELVGKDAFAPLETRTQKLLRDIIRLRVNDGLWLQVINMPDLVGNYQESSGSAMFVYALIKGGAFGVVEPPNDLMETLQRKVIAERSHGPAMSNICEVAGLGEFGNRFRDGSAEYYLSEAIVDNDAKGVGPLMMAYAESLLRAKSRISEKA